MNSNDDRLIETSGNICGWPNMSGQKYIRVKLNCSWSKSQCWMLQPNQLVANRCGIEAKSIASGRKRRASKFKEQQFDSVRFITKPRSLIHHFGISCRKLRLQFIFCCFRFAEQRKYFIAKRESNIYTQPTSNVSSMWQA